jgi:hypothetical protein
LVSPSRGSSVFSVRSSSKSARTSASSRPACLRFSPSYRWRYVLWNSANAHCA